MLSNSDSSTNRVVDLVAGALFALFALQFGYDSLRDYDLGWHLAGGLWMLEHRAVPRTDFLGAEGAPWVAYSWLAEIAFATVFALFDWRGLQHFQFLSIFLFLVTLYAALVSLPRSADDKGDSARIKALAVVLLVVPFVAPIWHLRPQLFSLSFLTIFVRLVLAVRERRSVPTVLGLMCLTVLWANVHVFWAFSPVLAFLLLFRRGELVPSLGIAVVLGVSGLLNPYGLDGFRALVAYGTNHEVGYRLIREFFPTDPTLGPLYWYFLIALAGTIWLLVKRRGALEACAILLTALSILQRKYLPSFGVLVAFCICAALPLLTMDRGGTRRGRSLAAALFAAGIAAFLAFFRPEPPLERQTEELFQAVDVLRAARTPSGVVLTDFDDGGWLGLVLYLTRDRTEDSSHLKTSIDGRTLVMGEERLAEYARLREAPLEHCEIIDQMSPVAAVLSSSSPLFAAFRSAQERIDERTACMRRFALVSEKGSWRVLQNMRITPR